MSDPRPQRDGPRRAARHLRFVERQQTALELRKQGFTYKEIAKHLEVSVEGARKAVKKAISNLEDRISESAAEVRRLELERLDRMLIRVWQQAVPPDVNMPPNLKAIEQVLKIMDRRSRYLGLDAAQKHEILSVDAIDEEIKRLEAELGETNG